ncbi:hypothetical protein HJFPF1_08640 [Paramyrothecium foliicola]|nr:hypothetical protein HJFPF1_08640 [Paramyrothecium foliicola]
MTPVIVQGFPTLRRPESCSGLELPFRLLREAAESTVTVSDGIYSLKGPKACLKMVKRLQNTFYWRDGPDAATPASKTGESGQHDSGQTGIAAISPAELEAGRHIICGDAPVSPHIADAGQCSMPPESVVDATAPGVLLNAKSTDASSASISGTSLTDCILSLPSDSEDVDGPEKAGTGFRFFKGLLYRLISAYQTETEEKASDGSGGGDASGSAQSQTGPDCQIEHDKSKALRRKSKPGSVKEQWLAIWKILFPEHPQPLSVYVESDVSEDFCLLQEFSQRRGLEILQEQLRVDGLTPRLGVTEREMQDTLTRGLDAIFNHFRKYRSSAASPLLHDFQEIGSEDPAQEGTATSSADSGVALRARLPQNGLGVTNRSSHAMSGTGSQEVFHDLCRENAISVAEESSAISSPLHLPCRGGTPPMASSATMTDAEMALEVSADLFMPSSGNPLGAIEDDNFRDLADVSGEISLWAEMDDVDRSNSLDKLLTSILDYSEEPNT